MTDNKQIRAEVNDILKAGWLRKVAAVTAALYAVVLAVWGGLKFFGVSEVVSMNTVLPWLFRNFIMYIFSAIWAFGMAKICIKAARRDEDRWIYEPLGGFRRPFETAWMLVVLNVKTILWTLLLIVPGIIAFFRYRLAWYFKCENPDWGAVKCIKESSAAMNGLKWQSFRLDLYYLGMMVLYYLGIIAVLVSMTWLSKLLGRFAAVQVIAWSLSALAGVCFCVFMFCLFIKMNLAHAVFYREAVRGGDGND